MKKSDIIKASIAKFRAEAQELLDNPEATLEQITEISNKITAEENRLNLQLDLEEAERKNLENNSTPLETAPPVVVASVATTPKINDELLAQAKDVQNYILNRPNTMEKIENFLGTGTDAAGGVAVGKVLSKEIIREVKKRANAYGFFNGRIGKGNLEIIVISEETGAEWVAEGKTPTSAADPKTNKIVIKQHRLYKEIEMTQQLVNSAPEEFVDAIINVVADAIKDTLEKAIFVGTGVNQPTGLTVELTDDRKVVLEAVGTLSVEDLKRAKYKIPQSEWENCSWFMDTSTLLAIDLLKDTTGRPVLQPDPSKATGQNILGIKVQTTAGISEISEASSVIAVLAHNSAYQTNTQKAIALEIYNDSTYKKKGTVGIASNMYVDGKVKNKKKVAVLVNPA